MLLVADSGSTKADWVLTLSDETSVKFRTSGINPFFLNEKDIIRVFADTPEIKPYADLVREVYFFGAGCSSPDRRELVNNALSKVFKNAFISVDIDIVASVYATCGSKPGVCCILGTGSNITYFDGTRIQDSKHGLGYILGDEGSGTYFGRQLLTSYLYSTMPAELADDFFVKYQIDKETVIQQTYQQASPNFFLASFAPFMSEHIQHPFIQKVLKEGFQEFVNSNINSDIRYRTHTCHFVGSIAFHFHDILKKVCEENGIAVGKILKHPIEDLAKFIRSNGLPI